VSGAVPGGRDLTDFEAAVLGVLTGLREGDVVTYGEVAAEAGRPGAHRAVGSFLRRSSGLGVLW
jgi:methylated-DNA-protein-cysteine methyltransferase related protein